MRVNFEKSKEKKQEVQKEFLPILILDSSGSMAGGKYSNAIKGLQKLAKEFGEGIFIEFSDADRIQITQFKNGIIYNNFQGGYTALNDAIGEVEKQVQKSGKKCLINIFTDGNENGSHKYSTTEAKDIIESLIAQKHTFSFVCTKQDFYTIKNKYGVPESNILTYENNAEGVEYAFKMSTRAVQMYKSAFAAGEDVTMDFYSKVL